MLKHIKNLDIVITRSCQLDCDGCLVFSNHNAIKGHTLVENSITWLEFWFSRLRPEVVHLFGGEPLMNPQFVDWVHVVNTFLIKQRKYKGLNVQTNGIKLASLGQELLDHLVNEEKVHFNISVHNQLPWYQAAIKSAVEMLEISFDGHWQQLNESEKIYRDGQNDKWFSVTDFTNTKNRQWVNHYNGYAETLMPGRNFDDEFYVKSHSYCEAKEYIQLYEGNLYKCPTLAVLGQTLNALGNPNPKDWEPWLQYKFLPVNCGTEQLEEWFATQCIPEKYCNMCFGEPKKITIHSLKSK